MYCKYFGLNTKPFSITPDPRFLFLSSSHREALAHLLYGIGEGGGFVQLTGEVGTGKTTLCRALLDKLPDNVDVALILNPKLTAQELVATICDELKIEYPRDAQSLKILIDHLNEHLLRTHAAGRRTIVIIDEAQNLSIEVLEQIRLLTNLETTQAKLLQIVLIGQPELQVLLARHELRQLAQRITARYHLGVLNRDEAQVYLTHRLKVSGGHHDLLTANAIDAIYRLSGGIPRLINILADRALLGAYVEEKRQVDQHIVRKAAREVLPEYQITHSEPRQAKRRPPAQPWSWRGPWHWPKRWPWRWETTAAAVIAGLVLLGLSWYGVTYLQNHAQAEVGDAGQSGSAAGDKGEELAIPPRAERDPKSAQGAADALASAGEPELLPPPDPAELDQLPQSSDLGERLIQAADESANLRAWSGLFKLWDVGLYLENDLRPCEQATRQGLRCLVRSGNWTQLRSFDRPAVLQMNTPNGKKVAVLLVALDAQQATLVLGGKRSAWPLREVDPYWLGQYMLLWRPPVTSEVLREGDTGPDVVWLRGLMDRLLPEARTSGTVADHFDAGLASRVKRFQAQHSLEQDGIVGSLTLIHLNASDERSGGPRLTTSESSRTS